MTALDPRLTSSQNDINAFIIIVPDRDYIVTKDIGLIDVRADALAGSVL